MLATAAPPQRLRISLPLVAARASPGATTGKEGEQSAQDAGAYQAKDHSADIQYDIEHGETIGRPAEKL
jgi:hypothetical protein